MQEELIAFVPVLLLLTRRLGFRPMVAVAMSLGAAAVAASFSPINPFQVGIAQKVAGLKLASGWEFRSAFLFPPSPSGRRPRCVYAQRTRTAPEEVGGGRRSGRGLASGGRSGCGARDLRGVRRGRAQVRVGLRSSGGGVLPHGRRGRPGRRAGRERHRGGYVDGFRAMAYASLLIGFARAIYVVMDQGNIVDTIVHGLFTPVASLPVTVSALAMMGLHTLVHLPVPSTSGHAVLTLPVLVPLSDLIGLSRQVTVLAYQYGAGLYQHALAHQRCLDGDARRRRCDVRRVAPLRGAGAAGSLVLAAVAIGVGVAVGV